jgi:hypothetical protein
MFSRVKFRKKTTWDNIGELAMSSYYFIMNIAFYRVRTRRRLFREFYE